MKILVIEDKQVHRTAAIETLVGHEVTIVSSFDEAMALLNGDPILWVRKSPDPIPFEVVLTDMMMPMSDRNIRSIWVPGEQVPYGFVIALKAALCGAKFVAMVTDTNHHAGAMSAALDHLGDTSYRDGFKPNFVVNGAKVLFIHTPFIKDFLPGTHCAWCVDGKGRRQDPSGQISLVKCDLCNGTGQEYTSTRKDWGKVLADLTA